MDGSPFRILLHHTATDIPPGMAAFRTRRRNARRSWQVTSSQSASSSGETLNSQSPSRSVCPAPAMRRRRSETSTLMSFAFVSGGTKRLISTASFVWDQIYLPSTVPPFCCGSAFACSGSARWAVAAVEPSCTRAALSNSSTPGQLLPPRRMAFSRRRTPSAASPFLRARSAKARHWRTSSRRSSPGSAASSSVSKGSSSSSTSMSTSCACAACTSWRPIVTVCGVSNFDT
mmetsp:Transcript_36160/g.75394  ORF Transcript_36160/g.75394 Transcript_36160/m.75394 type:complete len:231 (-) Transcript_36160:81-773(-)